MHEEWGTTEDKTLLYCFWRRQEKSCKGISNIRQKFNSSWWRTKIRHGWSMLSFDLLSFSIREKQRNERISMKIKKVFFWQTSATTWTEWRNSFLVHDFFRCIERNKSLLSLKVCPPVSLVSLLSLISSLDGPLEHLDLEARYTDSGLVLF